ncbi:MAG: hypothetical protein KC553_03950 [Nitrospina sp.]|nr:hypothetical protein [Nitrospina sp.]
MSEEDGKDKKEEPMNTKVLMIAIGGMLVVGFVAVLFVAVPSIFQGGEGSWKDSIVEDIVILLTLVMFVFGFYQNTKMH